MTAERYEQYKQAVATIGRFRGSKLHPDEAETLRDAAEGLLLSSDPDGEEARSLRAAAGELLANLVASDRWLEQTAAELRASLEGCCPLPEPAPEPALA